MKKILLLMFLSVIVSGSAVRSEMRVRVEGHGKRIQSDGFLLEWRVDKARVAGDAPAIRWDAMNTPGGLAGYFRYEAADSCGPWTFRFYPVPGAWHRYLEIKADTAVPAGALHGVDMVHTDSATHVALEWIVPWDTLHVDSSGEYALAIGGFGPCGDSMPGMLVSGVRRVPGPCSGIWSPRVITQFLVIAVLLVLYLVLRGRAKKYSRIRRKNESARME
ncbi:MAG: hypothetical protein GF418_01935 [Chitinivibrionales bacterium]|nr:hypothetical protein [Chitinivibrionales bacterium]MBD3394360.1 hypothetical protein [Chitinivibrionales bacterium]